MSNLTGLNFHLGEDIDALREAVRTFAAEQIARWPRRSTATICFRTSCGPSWASWACTA